MEPCGGYNWDLRARGVKGNAIDKDLTPFNVGADQHVGGTQQRKPERQCRCEDMSGSKERVLRSVQIPKNDQVALRCPPCSRHLNIGISGLSSKHFLAQHGSHISPQLGLDSK